jgi:hypothetical protein
MEGVRKFLESSTGKMVAVGLIVLALIIMWVSVRASFGPSSAGKASVDRLFIDAKTGKTFEYTLKKGDVAPILAPSGDKTGYPAELCYWTADGGTRKDPVPVLLNIYKGDNSPTFCPDCGRLVVGHNPRPEEGRKPPPKKDEYKPRRSTARD